MAWRKQTQPYNKCIYSPKIKSKFGHRFRLKMSRAATSTSVSVNQDIKAVSNAIHIFLKCSLK